MTEIQYLDPALYRRTPWKNGGGVSIEIARQGGPSWADMGVAWHFGRTTIAGNGPFSDLSGYERLQVVVKGSGLVLVTPDSEIDLRQPFRPQRYDGGLPIVTRLEHAPVDVVNLIADKAKFRIDLRVGSPGETLTCDAGIQIIHAPAGAAAVMLGEKSCTLPDDHAVRLDSDKPTALAVLSGRILIASIVQLPFATLRKP